MMTHPQVVSLIRGVSGNILEMTVERGDHVVPNMKECFPVKTEQDLVKVIVLILDNLYYQTYHTYQDD
jgi:hypothetical protein